MLLRRDGDVVPADDEVCEISMPYSVDYGLVEGIRPTLTKCRFVVCLGSLR